MATKEKKSQQIEILKEKMRHDFLVLLSYKGLNVKQQTHIRQQLREVGGEFSVVKNTLIKKVSTEYEWEELNPYLKNSTALLTSSGDFVRCARVLQDISKKYPQIETKAGVLHKKVITSQNIQDIASLPSREVLLGKFLSVLSSPLSQLLQVLQAPLQNLIFVLSEISNKKSDK